MLKKKRNKIKWIIFPIIIVFGMSIYILWWMNRTINIKTEYGDHFTVRCAELIDFYILRDMNSDFEIDLKFFGYKKEFIPICDTEYFRCYRIQNEKEDFYICRFKPDGNFFWIDPNIEELLDYYKQKYSEDFKKIFLSDKNIMEITLKYMDDIYHDEFIDMAKKMVSRDFDGLDKYGLTEDMISDTESLNEKITIMENYLKEYQ